MANYITTDADLTAVADAIRATGGGVEPLEFPDGFVSAIQELGGATNMEWKHLRTVTVPDELPDGGTDADGVNWTTRSEGGFYFGFNTDSEGQPLEITHDLFIRFNAGVSYSGTSGFNIGARADAGYGGSALAMCATLAKTGSKNYGWTRAENVGRGWLVTGYTNGGAGSGNMQAARDTELNGTKSLNAIGLFIVNRQNYGFESGSTFEFWYR